MHTNWIQKASLLLSSLWFHPHLCSIQHFFAATLHQLSVCLDDLSDTIPRSQSLAIQPTIPPFGGHYVSECYPYVISNNLKLPPWPLSEFLPRCAAAKVSRSRPGWIDVYLETLRRLVVGWCLIRLCWRFAHSKWCKLAWLLGTGTYSNIFSVYLRLLGSNCQYFNLCNSEQLPPSHASR